VPRAAGTRLRPHQLQRSQRTPHGARQRMQQPRGLPKRVVLEHQRLWAKQRVESGQLPCRVHLQSTPTSRILCGVTSSYGDYEALRSTQWPPDSHTTDRLSLGSLSPSQLNQSVCQCQREQTPPPPSDARTRLSCHAMPTHALPGNGARHHTTIHAPDTPTTFSAVSVPRQPTHTPFSQGLLLTGGL